MTEPGIKCKLTMTPVSCAATGCTVRLCRSTLTGNDLGCKHKKIQLKYVSHGNFTSDAIMLYSVHQFFEPALKVAALYTHSHCTHGYCTHSYVYNSPCNQIMHACVLQVHPRLAEQ